MSILFGSEDALEIVETDHLVRLLEAEALTNKQQGWLMPAVELDVYSLPVGMTMAQRKRTLDRLVALGLWKREALTLEGEEITTNADLYPEDEIIIYYYPIQWLHHTVAP